MLYRNAFSCFSQGTLAYFSSKAKINFHQKTIIYPSGFARFLMKAERKTNQKVVLSFQKITRMYGQNPSEKYIYFSQNPRHFQVRKRKVFQLEFIACYVICIKILVVFLKDRCVIATGIYTYSEFFFLL